MFTLFLQGFLRVPHLHSSEHSVLFPLQGQPRVLFSFRLILQELLQSQRLAYAKQNFEAIVTAYNFLQYMQIYANFYLPYCTSFWMFCFFCGFAPNASERIPTISDKVFICAEKMRTRWHCSFKWTFNLLDEILKKFETGKNITTSGKSILNLVKLQSLVVKCSKIWKI